MAILWRETSYHYSMQRALDHQCSGGVSSPLCTCALCQMLDKYWTIAVRSWLQRESVQLLCDMKVNVNATDCSERTPDAREIEKNLDGHDIPVKSQYKNIQ